MSCAPGVGKSPTPSGTRLCGSDTEPPSFGDSFSGWFRLFVPNFGNAVCCSVNVYGVVILLGGVGDSSTLHAVIELFALVPKKNFFNLS